jgi:sugar phosphate isomerase/epimerase
LDKLEKFARFGFDYIEPTVTSLVEMDARALAAAETRLRACGIAVEACNVFLPRGITLIGPAADRAAYRAYLDDAAPRVAALGAKYIVFGSGGARRAPEGYDPAAARAELRDAILRAGEAAAARDLAIVIEPLNTGETNLVNTVADGLSLAREIAHEGVKLLADFYHMRRENEPLKNVAEAGSLLRHTHVAQGQSRAYPLSAQEDDYAGFFEALKAGGYTGAVSIEGRTDDEDNDAPKALALLRELSARAGL